MNNTQDEILVAIFMIVLFIFLATAQGCASETPEHCKQSGCVYIVQPGE